MNTQKLCYGTKPVLYEVPIYLALNFNWNTKQKNKKKKSDGKF